MAWPLNDFGIVAGGLAFRMASRDIPSMAFVCGTTFGCGMAVFACGMAFNVSARDIPSMAFACGMAFGLGMAFACDIGGIAQAGGPVVTTTLGATARLRLSTA